MCRISLPNVQKKSYRRIRENEAFAKQPNECCNLSGNILLMRSKSCVGLEDCVDAVIGNGKEGLIHLLHRVKPLRI